MLKALIAFLPLVLTQAQASSDIKLKEVEIVDAAYVDLKGSKTIEVIAKYNGGCSVSRDTKVVFDLKINACTEMVPHDKCVASLLIAGDPACVVPVEEVFVVPRETIKYNHESLSSNKFDNAKILIKGKTSEKEVQLKRF